MELKEKKESLTDRVIKYALKKGYWADENGNVYSPSGRRMRGPINSTGYKTLTLVNPLHPRGFCTILFHRFIAAYFHGEVVLSAPCIRHLDDVRTNNNPDNLAPGTYKDNRNDIPKEKLSMAAKPNAHLLVARSRKLTDEDIASMRHEREQTGLAYNKLAKKYGVTTMTAYRCCVGQSWK